MTHTTNMTLGDLVSLMYEEFMDLYGDEELASVAAAAVINDLIAATVEGVDEGLEEAA